MASKNNNKCMFIQKKNIKPVVIKTPFCFAILQKYKSICQSHKTIPRRRCIFQSPVSKISKLQNIRPKYRSIYQSPENKSVPKIISIQVIAGVSFINKYNKRLPFITVHQYLCKINEEPLYDLHESACSLPELI